jgi:hypothetical protein
MARSDSPWLRSLQINATVPHGVFAPFADEPGIIQFAFEDAVIPRFLNPPRDRDEGFRLSLCAPVFAAFRVPESDFGELDLTAAPIVLHVVFLRSARAAACANTSRPNFG